jgi:hypothetical protein
MKRFIFISVAVAAVAIGAIINVGLNLARSNNPSSLTLANIDSIEAFAEGGESGTNVRCSTQDEKTFTKVNGQWSARTDKYSCKAGYNQLCLKGSRYHTCTGNYYVQDPELAYWSLQWTTVQEYMCYLGLPLSL